MLYYIIILYRIRHPQPRYSFGRGGADMKKRIVLCLLALALLSVMTGCGKKKDADPLTVTLWRGVEYPGEGRAGQQQRQHP